MHAPADIAAMLYTVRAALAAFVFVTGLSTFSSTARGTDIPRVVVMRAPRSISVGGDCNNPAVWVGDRVHVFASPYAQNDQPAGVSYYWSGPSIEDLDRREYVAADRNAISATPRQSYGPWFETVIADDSGVLWAYYHAEFGAENGLHPRIGSQVSDDGGATWRDLGVIIDTPANTDAAQTRLGYGFVGGNGDFSAILDRDREYLYFFISQYGVSPDVQGVAVARMRWADRAEPVGKVWKKHSGSWEQPGLGGAATPLLANVGDAHGVNAPIDFWWGPSVHWNSHLERYVILLSRSTTGEFTSGGPANWVMYGNDISDTSSWTAPVPVEFPNGFKGGWYPVAIGTEKYETDNFLGRTARIFVEGSSHWRAVFLRPGEDFNPADYPTLPEVTVHAGDGSNVINLQTGDTLPITSVATDVDGDMTEHWLELRSPSGIWSWEGWLNGAPWDGALVGNDRNSTKNVSYTFAEPGEYVIRGTAVDPNSTWVLSSEIRVVVSGIVPPPPDTPDSPPVEPSEDPPAPPAPPEEPATPPSGSGNETAPALPVVSISVGGVEEDRTVALGTTLVFESAATDANGDMLEHWLELHAPDRSWSWEGWLTSAPWLGILNGNGHRSEKSASFTFVTPGTYLIRASAVDSQGQWIISAERSITVLEP
jgi:hypothetical protein